MTMRSVQDRFWSDGWVRKLNPLDRYLFLYLLTNEHTNWAGTYELDLSMMAFESGIDERDLQRSMLPRLSPKIVYVEGWVHIPNWVKHHMSDSGTLSPSQKEGMRKAMDKVPEHIRRKIKQIHMEGIPYAYPMVGVSPSSSSLSSAFISAPRGFDYIQSPEEETERPKTKPKYPNSKEVFSWFPNPEKSWALNTTELKHAELLYERGETEVKKRLAYVAANSDEDFMPVITKPSDLERKWNDIKAYAKRNR